MPPESKYPILEKCSTCHQDLRAPRTLPCLHSFCSDCIDDVIQKQRSAGIEEDVRRDLPSSNLLCPLCRSDFELPNGEVDNLPVNPFVRQLAKRKLDSSTDPKDAKCSCEEEIAIAYCTSGDGFLGNICLKSHNRLKATANHQTISIEEYFAENKFVYRCPIHAGCVIDVFCKTCSVPLCAQCVVPDHISHACVKLTRFDLGLSEEILKSLEPVQARERNLREAASASNRTIEELNQSAQSTIEEIIQTFGIIQDSLEKRKNELLSEAEAIRFAKETKLKSQRKRFDFIAEGMRSSAEFAQGLMEMGSQTEVALSKKALLSRLTALQGIGMGVSIHEDSSLRFDGRGKDEVIRVLRAFGSVSGNQTSSKTSKIDWASGSKGGSRESTPLNERVTFKILSMNKEGERIMRGGDGYSVRVADNSKTEAEIVDHNDGSYSVSYVPTVKGTHHVSVSLGGEDIQGSPFDLRVTHVSAKTSYLEASKDLGIFPSLGSIEMTIVAVEEDGTPLKHGGETFTCLVTAHQPQAPPMITDLKDGTYRIKFVPVSSGKYTVSVKLNGEDIKGSPKVLSFFGNTVENELRDPAQFQLLYDSSADGCSIKKFHEKCDNVSGTVTLVTLKNGTKFGGYNSGRWTSESGSRGAPTSFLFSLTNGKEGSVPQKFPLKDQNDNGAISCNSYHGPLFGAGPDFHVNLDNLSKSSSTPGSYSLPNKYALAGSQSKWSITNVQIFRVL